MTITIEVTPEIETRLQEESNKAGLPVQEIVFRLLKERFSMEAASPQNAWEELILSMGVPANVLSDDATRREFIYED